MMIELSKRILINDRKLLIGVAIFAILLFIALMFVIAVQQKRIVELDARIHEHEELTDFMNEGARFTLEDGKVLFMICDKDNVTPEAGRAVKEIYDATGTTDFRDWLLEESEVHNK